MATSPSALSNLNNSDQGQSSFSPSQMVGDPAQGQMQAQAPSLPQATEQIRICEQTLLGLAQQFPNVAPDVRRAIEAVRSVAKGIVSQPGLEEPQSPRSLG